MTDIVENDDKISQISINTDILDPSPHSLLDHNEELPQPKYKDLQEMKIHHQSACSIVESLRMENTLVGDENKIMKEKFLEHIKLITEENLKLRNEMRELNLKIERGNEELEDKIKKLEDMLLQHNQEFYNDPEKKNEKNMFLEEYQHVDEKKPSDDEITLFDDNSPEKNIVYGTRKGLCYHVKSCPSLHTSSIATPLFEAKKKWRACAKCRPANTPEIMVYRTRTGLCYHRKKCRYLRSSCVPSSLIEAKKKLKTCSKCCLAKVAKVDDNFHKEMIVYGTSTGSCYHKETCCYLISSKVATSITEARLKWRPCAKCWATQ